MEITPFGAPALAMETVLDAVEAQRLRDDLRALLAPGPKRAPSTVAVFGTGALVDAAVLDLYRRRRLDLLVDAALPVPRVLLFGPDARARRTALVALLGTDLSVLEIDAIDVELGQEFLRYTWRRLPPDFVVWTTGAPGSAQAGVARAEGVTLPHARGENPRGSALAIWRTIVAAERDPGTVRVVALPGASTEEILIARALGAAVGRVETTAATDLSRDLLGGGTDIVPLPDDRMTVRAFLRRGTWPRDIADPEPIAEGLHRCYVHRHRDRKPPGDPVLEPWDALSEWLRDSNRAVVDDIPDKLSSLGYRLARPGEGPVDGAVDVLEVVGANLELLAEQGHGRFAAERLTSGWTGGVRDPARFMSPHLKPWDELDEEAKEYDREVLHDVFTAMTKAGVRVVPAH